MQKLVLYLIYLNGSAACLLLSSFFLVSLLYMLIPANLDSCPFSLLNIIHAVNCLSNFLIVISTIA